jgi:hypothetical protein
MACGITPSWLLCFVEMCYLCTQIPLDLQVQQYFQAVLVTTTKIRVANHVLFIADQVPHSQCQLRENPIFCKILALKITHLEKSFDQYSD